MFINGYDCVRRDYNNSVFDYYGDNHTYLKTKKEKKIACKQPLLRIIILLIKK